MEQKIFFHEKSIYVTIDFLIECKVPKSTIYNNTSRGCPINRRWHCISHPSNRKEKLIAFDSIPPNIIQLHSLPSKDKLIELYHSFNLNAKENQKSKSYYFIKFALDSSYKSWRAIKDTYENELFTDDRLELFCKTHSLLTKCVELLEYKYKIKDIYTLFIQYRDVAYNSIGYKSFCKKINRIRRGGSVEDEVIHGLINLPSNNIKMTEDVIFEIKRHFCNPKKLNAAQILENVNNYLISLNRKTISLASIYRIISQPYVQNECMIARHGKKYSEVNLEPYTHFEAPKDNGELWMIDGSRFQFAYRTDEKKINFLTFFVVMDCASRRIIGYSYDSSENKTMIKRALEMACKETKYLPKEIASDNSSSLKSTEMASFQALTKLWGVNWRFIRPMNSRDNAYVERFFGIFQESICKNYDGYIGEGIKSSNLDGRPSMEELQKQLTNKNLRNKAQLIQLLEELVKRYNSHRNPRKECSPNDKYNEECNESECLIEINPIMICQLFWQIKEVTVNHGSVSFFHEKEQYFYNIYDDEMLFRLNGIKVKVRFNPKDFSKVLIFNNKTDKYITTLDKFTKIPKVTSSRSEEENLLQYKHFQQSKELTKKLQKRINEIYYQSDRNRENLPPELTENGMVSKIAREEAEANYLEEELNRLAKVEDSEEVEKSNYYAKRFNSLYFSKGNLKIVN